MPAGGDPALARLQSAIGHHFLDQSLLLQALTHSSEDGANQQRLEFLGDAVLAAAISVHLFQGRPDWAEGEMSVARTSLVCQENLSRCARLLGVPAVLRVSRAVARSGAVHERDSVLADTVEALIGAVFLDGGFAAASSMAVRLLDDGGSKAPGPPAKDAKTRLQEWLQDRGWPLPEYRVIARSGPANALLFRAECSAGRPLRRAEGEGRSRRAAEQEAAASVLSQLEAGAGSLRDAPAGSQGGAS